jgi:septum formation protein
MTVRLPSFSKMNLPNLRRLADGIGLVLVSGSPRRKRILTEAGIRFEVMLPSVEEHIRQELPPEMLAMDLACQKIRSVAPDSRRAYLGCDTIVVLNGEILTKPADENDAFRMLKKLSGNCHSVFTGLTLFDSCNDRWHQMYEESRVCFNRLDDEAVRGYISTGEPLDKAGAYGIQGMGGFLVDSVEGNVDNVVGLPMTALEKLAAFILE